MGLPSGMVVFLFTDIEGSSQRSDRSRASMREAVATHDALLDEAIARNRGHVVKKLGDGFMAAFGDPVDAVQTADRISSLRGMLVGSRPTDRSPPRA